MNNFLSEISLVCDSVAERENYIFPAKSAAVADKQGHFPLSDVAQARNALAQVEKYDALPKWYLGNLSLEKFKEKVRRDVKTAFPSIKVSDNECTAKVSYRHATSRRKVADATADEVHEWLQSQASDEIFDVIGLFPTTPDGRRAAMQCLLQSLADIENVAIDFGELYFGRSVDKDEFERRMVRKAEKDGAFLGEFARDYREWAAHVPAQFKKEMQQFRAAARKQGLRVKDSFDEEIGITADMEREDAHDKLRAYLDENKYAEDAIKKVAQVLIDHDWPSIKTERDGRTELMAVATFQDGTPVYSYKQKAWKKISDAASISVGGLEWATANLTGHGGTEVDGRWYYTWEQAMNAAKEVGDGWRLPTLDEFDALAKLGSEWDEDREGRVFGGKLFLPSSGFLHRDTGEVSDVSSEGYYWSSSPTSGSTNAGYLGSSATYVGPLSSSGRAYGFTVRLVRGAANGDKPIEDDGKDGLQVGDKVSITTDEAKRRSRLLYGKTGVVKEYHPDINMVVLDIDGSEAIVMPAMCEKVSDGCRRKLGDSKTLPQEDLIANTPKWVADKEIWDQAVSKATEDGKKEAEATLVVAVYKKLGGKIVGKTTDSRNRIIDRPLLIETVDYHAGLDWMDFGKRYDRYGDGADEHFELKYPEIYGLESLVVRHPTSGSIEKASTDTSWIAMLTADNGVRLTGEKAATPKDAVANLKAKLDDTVKRETKELDAADKSDSVTDAASTSVGGLEWASDNLTGHGGTEVDGRWYYTWEQAMNAAKEVGDGWRLPTRADFVTLTRTGSEWDAAKGGRTFGDGTFLPASGYIPKEDDAPKMVGEQGAYWNNSASSLGNKFGAMLSFDAALENPGDSYYRYGLLSVRLVRDKNRSE